MVASGIYRHAYGTGEGGRQVIISRLSPTKLIEKGEAQSCESGYLFLKRLYHKVGMDRICEAISRKHKFDFDFQQSSGADGLRTALRPASKLGNYRRSGSYIEPFDIEKQHIYRSLDIPDRHGEYIQKRLFLNSSKVVERDTTVMYYDCTNYFFERESADPDYVTDKKGTFMNVYASTESPRNIDRTPSYRWVCSSTTPACRLRCASIPQCQRTDYLDSN